MPPELKPLPPDHPLFTIGVGFVFGSELPEDEEAFGQAARFLRRLRHSGAADDIEHEHDVGPDPDDAA